MALISAGPACRPARCFDSQELINEPSFYERGILQTMHAWRRADGDDDLAGALRRRGGRRSSRRRCSASTPPKRSATGLGSMTAEIETLHRDGIV